MNVLLVGAGAVGQVYAHHLRLGGAEIGFFVREKYARSVRDGLILHPLNGSRDPVRLETTAVKTDFACLPDEGWEQIWLCVSATAVQQGDWVERLVAAAPDAAIVALQPGHKAAAFLRERIPPARLAFGLITFIAWQAPLPGEKLLPPGVQYWLPPSASALFAGPDSIVHPIVETLQHGGMAAQQTDDLAGQTILATAALSSGVAALEAAGWSFASLRRDTQLLRLAIQSARQAAAISAQLYNRPAPSTRAFLRPWVLKNLLRVAPRFVPFDLERYLKYHFTKVGDQTRDTLAYWIEQGRNARYPVDAIQDLRARIP